MAAAVPTVNRTTNQKQTYIVCQTHIIIRNHFVQTCTVFRRPKATDDRPFALGRFASYHVGALETVKESGRDVKLFINIPNHLGHSAYDIAWNNKKMRDDIIH